MDPVDVEVVGARGVEGHGKWRWLGRIDRWWRGGGKMLVLPELPELGIGMAARSASICHCTILSDSCSTKALNLETSTPRKNG